jgi:hypothetical protein
MADGKANREFLGLVRQFHPPFGGTKQKIGGLIRPSLAIGQKSIGNDGFCGGGMR